MRDTDRRTIRVLVADDVPDVREGLAALFAAYGVDVVGETGDGREAIALAAQLRPDVAIVDCRMPGVDGITAALHITTLVPNVAVLLHTAHSDRDLVTAAQAAGAYGYLWKGTAGADIVAAVREAAEHARTTTDATTTEQRWVEWLES